MSTAWCLGLVGSATCCGRRRERRTFSAWSPGGPGNRGLGALQGRRMSATALPLGELSNGGSSSPERTKQLLFQGAQAYSDHIWGKGCSVNHLRESLKPGLMGAPPAARGQMLIGPDGRLTRCQAQASEAGEWLPAELACYCV